MSMSSRSLARSAVAALMVIAAALAWIPDSASASHLGPMSGSKSGLMNGLGHSGSHAVTGPRRDSRNAWFIPYAGGRAWNDCHEADPNGPPLCPHRLSNHVNETYSSNAGSYAGQARSAFFGD